MEKLRVGVIGCGRISVMHLVPANYLDEAELVACCDIKEDRARETAEKYGIKHYFFIDIKIITRTFLIQ